MSEGWPKVELAKVGVAVLDCVHKTPKDAGQGYPYLAIPNIRDNRIDLSGVRRISKEDLEAWTTRYKPAARDILVTRRGRVGDTAVIPEGMECAIGQNLVLLRSDGSLVDQQYLSWVCRGPDWWAEVERLLNVGAVFDSLNVRDLPKFRLPVPPLEEQRRIAGVLGALDDLIDTNRSLIDALIRQADSVAGAFPVEGERMTFGEVCDVFGGATPKTSEPSYWNGELSWATPSDITALRSPYLFATSRQITQAGLDACSSDLHPPGAILMTSRATIGAFALTQVPAATNQGFIVVEPRRPEDRYFLFHEMRRRVPEFMDRANGSTFMEISRGTFKSLPVDWPSERDRDELARKVEPLHEAAVELEREAAELELCRDELLPLLLSGRVRVDQVAA